MQKSQSSCRRDCFLAERCGVGSPRSGNCRSRIGESRGTELTISNRSHAAGHRITHKHPPVERYFRPNAPRVTAAEGTR